MKTSVAPRHVALTNSSATAIPFKLISSHPTQSTILPPRRTRSAAQHHTPSHDATVHVAHQIAATAFAFALAIRRRLRRRRRLQLRTFFTNTIVNFVVFAAMPSANAFPHGLRVVVVRQRSPSLSQTNNQRRIPTTNSNNERRRTNDDERTTNDGDDDERRTTNDDDDDDDDERRTTPSLSARKPTTNQKKCPSASPLQNTLCLPQCSFRNPFRIPPHSKSDDDGVLRAVNTLKGRRTVNEKVTTNERTNERRPANERTSIEQQKRTVIVQKVYTKRTKNDFVCDRVNERRWKLSVQEMYSVAYTTPSRCAETFVRSFVRSFVHCSLFIVHCGKGNFGNLKFEIEERENYRKAL